MAMKRYQYLSRRRLLQLLIREREENQNLRRELERRALIAENTGSLAEAALQLSGIFEAADHAAKIYLENIDRELLK